MTAKSFSKKKIADKLGIPIEHVKEILNKHAQLEKDIFALRAQGLTYREIANQLGTSPATISRVLKKKNR